jgi:hypothetical protein
LKSVLGSAGHKTHRKVFYTERLCNLGSIFMIKKILEVNQDFIGDSLKKKQRLKIVLYIPFNKP